MGMSADLHDPADSGVALAFDYFPGMVYQRSPRFRCGELRDQPALDWTGMLSPELKSVAARFPVTLALARRYNWTLRISYFLLFAGPTLALMFGLVLGPNDVIEEIRTALFLVGLLATGCALLLNKDATHQLPRLVQTFNELSAAGRKTSWPE
jgi:hypothetical protein